MTAGLSRQAAASIATSPRKPVPAPKSVLIMANPTAGGYRQKVLDKVRRELTASGFDVRLHLTSHAGEIGDVCADPSLRIGTLVIAGGDGSVNEAMTGLQAHPAPPALAVIPFGTANVLAHELGLPRRAKAVARAIAAHQVRPLHAGRANGHPFVLMASAGFDAEVVHAMPLSLKRRFGKLAYVLIALKTGFPRQSPDLFVHLQDETLAGKLVVVTNGRYYGGPFSVCPEACVCDPGLHLLVLEKDDPLSLMRFSAALLLGRVHKTRGVVAKTIQRARLTAAKPVAAQIDGDPFGTTPILVEAGGPTLDIIVP
ncbi:MAG: diacylglycerol kinase family lipid kinase [Roseibium sp.]|nr:diacylglycerol kinase family lipid kinase [Roseibium sp.]